MWYGECMFACLGRVDHSLNQRLSADFKASICINYINFLFYRSISHMEFFDQPPLMKMRSTGSTKLIKQCSNEYADRRPYGALYVH